MWENKKLQPYFASPRKSKRIKIRNVKLNAKTYYSSSYCYQTEWERNVFLGG